MSTEHMYDDDVCADEDDDVDDLKCWQILCTAWNVNDNESYAHLFVTISGYTKNCFRGELVFRSTLEEKCNKVVELIRV